MWFSKSETAKAKVVESTLNLTYPVSVRRSSRRRSIELRVTAASDVWILCPLEISDTQIVDFLRSRADWIESKLLLNQTRAALPCPDYESGSIWQLRGQGFVLELSVGPRSVVLDTDRLRVKTDSMDTEKVKGILKSWYIQQAEDCLLGRTQHFASCLGVKPSRVQLRQYRSQWGRCNSRQEIAFDWRVIMAPDSVIDYLVIHELCHIKHFNHSSDFWSLVGSLQPNYRESKDWLRANSYWIKQTFGSV